MAEMTLAAVARGLTPRADQPGVFSGYASLFGTVDSQGDLVETGAFRPSLEAWRAKGRRPAMLWQHDHADPIGLWTGIEEDATGLRVEGRLLLSVRSGAEAYEHIKAGTVTGLSIGYQAIESRRDRKTGLRFLSKVTLWEISLVTFPANEEARIAQVKTDEEGRERLAQALRRVFFSRPVLPFQGKNARSYLRLRGRPEPRDERGRFVEDGLGEGLTSASARDRTEGDPTREARRAVDWRFISHEEGGQQLRGYVPLDRDGKGAAGESGVTFATGFDAGQWSEAGFMKLHIRPQSLKESIRDVLRPFFSPARAGAAVARLDEETRAGRAPVLTKEQADALDEAARRHFYEHVERLFDKRRAAAAPAFRDLPAEAQTVVLSVAFQRGPGFLLKSDKKRKTDAIRDAVLAANWPEAIQALRNWSPNPKDRRKREALLLDDMLKRRSERRR